MSDWMPIESAPKDGTEVIGMDARGRVCRMWFFAPSSRTKNWLRFDDAKHFEPTRWMPLPNPKVGSGGDNRT